MASSYGPEEEERDGERNRDESCEAVDSEVVRGAGGGCAVWVFDEAGDVLVVS